MTSEEQLANWTQASSDSEKDKQERTERMIQEAISAHTPFDDCSLRVFAKGSYANGTNVRADSDVDIAVQCLEAFYWDEVAPGIHKPSGNYAGVWTPKKLRSELLEALRKKFGSQVDASGSTAIQVNSSSARIDADVVPCFTYRYYGSGWQRDGTKIFKTDGSSLINYPQQQLTHGTNKDASAGYFYKPAVRLLKRIENEMADKGYHPPLPSFFVESLVFNCPNTLFVEQTWSDTLRAIILYIWRELEGEEPGTNRWTEANGCKYLFVSQQEWTRKDGRDFAAAAWNYVGFE